MTMAFANDSIPSDLSLLQERRGRQIEKIDSTYKKELLKLREKYTKRGDLDTANLIDSILKNKFPLAQSFTNLAKDLVGTKWTWPEPKFKEKDSWFRLHADGTTSAGWHKRKGTWKLINKDSVVINVSGIPVDIKLKFHDALIYAWDSDKPHVLYKQITSK